MPRRLEALSGIVLALHSIISKMHRRTAIALAPMLVLLLLANTGTAHAAWSIDPYQPLIVCDAPGAQLLTASCPDGSGGVFVSWTDLRGTGYDVYLTRLLADGSIAPGWPANGLGVATQNHLEGLSQVASDGAGGVFIAWIDSTVNHWDIRLNRFDGAGTVVPGWPAGGLLLSNSNAQEGDHRLAVDGAGGVWVAWVAHSVVGPTRQVKAVRVNGDGTYATGFAQGGFTYRSLDSDIEDLRVCSAGTGGLYVAWIDERDLGANGRDLYGQRVQLNGFPAWTTQGIRLTPAPGEQADIEIAADGAGRCFAAWRDSRSGSTEILAQTYGQDGLPLFGVDLVVCTGSGLRTEPIVLWDGVNSFFVAWEDERSGSSRDVYVQRIGQIGIPLWTANGVAAGTGTSDQALASMALDGQGGVMVVWPDDRLVPFRLELYAQRFNGAGTRLWANNGVPIGRGTGYSWGEAIPDGKGSLIYVTHASALPWTDVVAIRLDRYGILGDPSPPSIAVSDVPNDQGGFVRVAWDASSHDAGPDFLISEYSVWRSVPSLEALTALESGAAIVAGNRDARESAVFAGHSVAPRSRLFRTSLQNGQTMYWEHIGAQPAQQLPSYSMVVPTTSDSINGSNPSSSFQVGATWDDRTVLHHWFSAPASGYSVDNLVPPMPVPFVVNFQGPDKYLHWGPSVAPDLRGYIVYRGVTPDFELNGGTYVAEVQDTNYVDHAPADFYYYKLTAVDVHGNQSPPALVVPPGTVDVDGPPSATLRFAAPRPNPSSGPVTLRWSQPAEAEATLRIYDASGRMVAELASGRHAAGEHTVQWTSRIQEGGSMSPGLYFARLELAGRSLVRRIARVR
jgi:hypothetical protein